MTIAIISALPQEQAGLVQHLKKANSVKKAGRMFTTGLLHGKAVVLMVCGIGKVAAATTAAVLIEHFNATHIVFTGVAGGLAPVVNVGDVVVGSHYLQHDMDASPLFPKYEVPMYGMSQFVANPQLCEGIDQAACSVSRQALLRFIVA